MWRLLVLALLLANGVYFAWGNGYLLPYGFGPTQQSEPQRLAQQIKPEVVKILSAKDFQRIEEQVKAERNFKECLQAGPFDEQESAVLRQLLSVVLPTGSWQLEATPAAGRWIIYMGKYASADALAKKRAEVSALKIKTETLENPDLEPGFSLGAFDSEAEAGAALTRLGAQGLRTARVLQERPSVLAYQLRLPEVGEALRPKLAALRAALGDKTLATCK